MEILEKGKKKHRCDLPGFFRRWRLGLKDGAVIKCTCNREYIWDSDGAYWARVYGRTIYR